jgi:hypothetical protein
MNLSILNLEIALDTALELTNVDRKQTPRLTIIRGIHSKHGESIIIAGPFDEAILISANLPAS